MIHYEAKTKGKGDKMVHTYFPSQSWPGLLHRLCTPTGRLWQPDVLTFKPPVVNVNGWSRKCPQCATVLAAYTAGGVPVEVQ